MEHTAERRKGWHTMTRKEEQMRVNEIVKKAYDEYKASGFHYDYFKDLRSCSALVYTSPKYYILQSYSTIIAIIDRETDTLYDFSRMVYGYTATSAKHVSKFNKDYGAGMWGCKNVYTYKAV